MGEGLSLGNLWVLYGDVVQGDGLRGRQAEALAEMRGARYPMTLQ
jgi:hypothetical protein